MKKFEVNKKDHEFLKFSDEVKVIIIGTFEMIEKKRNKYNYSLDDLKSIEPNEEHIEAHQYIIKKFENFLINLKT